MNSGPECPGLIHLGSLEPCHAGEPRLGPRTMTVSGPNNLEPALKLTKENQYDPGRRDGRRGKGKVAAVSGSLGTQNFGRLCTAPWRKPERAASPIWKVVQAVS